MSSRFSRDLATVLANIVLPEPWGKYLNVKCIDNSLVRLVTFFLWPDQQYEGRYERITKRNVKSKYEELDSQLKDKHSKPYFCDVM